MLYRFADCEIDTDRHTLTRGGAAVRVEPQVFDLIHLLVRNAGELVTRDQMIEEVWQGRIVSESAISACIAAARKAVGDDGKRQAVIRTVARRGLQWVAETRPELDRAEAPPQEPDDTQRIRYTTNARGHSLAYAVTGSGPPLVRVGYNLTHLEEEWRVDRERAFFGKVGERFSLVRFDPAGVGLSEPAPVEVDFDAMADDIVAVAAAAGYDRFAVFSQSGGVLSAVRTAVRHPERITRLVIMAGYVDGRARRAPDPQPDAIRAMLSEGWGKPDSGMVPAFMMSYFPEGPLEAIQEYVRITQASCPREQVLRIRDASNAESIADLLGQVRCPTLVLHSRHDGVHPLSEARKLAAGIPNAELVVLETANLIPLQGQPEWPRMMQAFLDFAEG